MKKEKTGGLPPKERDVLMAKKGLGHTAEMVWKLAQPIVDGLGLLLWDVRFLKEGANWYLRVYIDKETGVTIEDCEAVSRALDGPLDQADIIGQSYCLEVCSPGLERELVRDFHYERFIGADIMVKMIRPLPVLGKEFGGTLTASDKQTFTIADADGQKATIEKKDTAWVKLDDFDL